MIYVIKILISLVICFGIYRIGSSYSDTFLSGWLSCCVVWFIFNIMDGITLAVKRINLKP
jgi:hypothetical protein